jgi:hypothetical protein
MVARGFSEGALRTSLVSVLEILGDTKCQRVRTPEGSSCRIDHLDPECRAFSLHLLFAIGINAGVALKGNHAFVIASVPGWYASRHWISSPVHLVWSSRSRVGLFSGVNYSYHTIDEMGAIQKPCTL